MKNKGFTLIEIIITITIMALIAITLGTNMLGLFSKEEDKEKESFVRKLTDAACMYVETSFSSNERANCKRNGCVISIDNLISKGLIEDNLKDPETDEFIINDKNKYKVNVKWENDEKKCTLNS